MGELVVVSDDHEQPVDIASLGLLTLFDLLDCLEAIGTAELVVTKEEIEIAITNARSRQRHPSGKEKL